MTERLPPRARLACLVCNAARRVLRLLGRGGTNLPGQLALRLCPTLPALLSRGVRIIAVSGTNGKTTTCRMLAAGLERAGVAFFANRSGANLRAGVTAELAANIRRGAPVRRVAVLECDEAALRTLAGQLRPALLVYTNVFRDQLDRYGEVTHTLRELEEAALAAPDATLCLNADDSLIASLALRCENPIRFYGVGVPVGQESGARSDAPNCVRCGRRYEYDYRTYAHLGGFFCPACGWRRPQPSAEVTEIRAMDRDGSDIVLRIGGSSVPLRVPLPAVYNIYNAHAAASALDAIGVDAETIRESMHAAAGFGRMERFGIGRGVTMILVKNPAGFTQVLDWLAGTEEEFDLLCCLNHKAQDGRDVSWIWDVPLERLAGERARVRTVAVSGTRGAELLLRLKHAGLPPARLRLVKKDRAFLRRITAAERPLVVVPTYTAMMRLRPVLARRTGKQAFWE
jgi:UDP-N-acetylmuramyl tripeptide synthase